MLVIRNVPPEVLPQVRQCFPGSRARGRGRRVIDGKRYFQSLPSALAERFSVYIATTATLPYSYADFVEIDNSGRVVVSYNGEEWGREYV